MISVNYSLLVEIVLFLAIVVFLQKFLFQPLLKLWDKREELIEGNRKKAESLARQTDQMIVYYEAQLWAARKLAQEEKERIRRQGAKEQEELVQKARAEAQEQIADLREKIALEYRELTKKVEKESELLAQRIAEQILGRTISE